MKKIFTVSTSKMTNEGETTYPDASHERFVLIQVTEVGISIYSKLFY